MEDPLQCQLIKVDGRIYRDLSSSSSPSASKKARGEQRAAEPRRKPPSQTGDHLDEPGASAQGAQAISTAVQSLRLPQDDPDICEADGGFATTVPCDSQLHGCIVGQRGRTLKQLEEESGGVVIRVPPRDAAPGSSGSITIKGGSREAVAKAKRSVEVLLQSAAASSRTPYTHFVSIPLAGPENRRRADAFREEALAAAAAGGGGGVGLDVSVFVPGARLHWTLVMLKLWSEERRQRAKQALLECRLLAQRLQQEGPLTVELKGLKLMGGVDPTRAHVMYIDACDVPTHPGGRARMQRLADGVVAKFKEAGLLQHETQDSGPVMLHATLINTSYRSAAAAAAPEKAGGRGAAAAVGEQQQQQGRPPQQQRQPFNATPLLRSQGGTSFGQQWAAELHLSTRGESDASGYYLPLAKIPLAT